MLILEFACHVYIFRRARSSFVTQLVRPPLASSLRSAHEGRVDGLCVRTVNLDQRFQVLSEQCAPHGHTERDATDTRDQKLARGRKEGITKKVLVQTERYAQVYRIQHDVKAGDEREGRRGVYVQEERCEERREKRRGRKGTQSLSAILRAASLYGTRTRCSSGSMEQRSRK